MTEGETTVATKRGKQTGARSSKAKSTKAAAGPAADRRRADRRTGDEQRVKTVARAVERHAGLLEQAMRLRDTIQRSKLTATDPWGYAAKARGWGERAQTLVDRAARGGDAASLRLAVEALSVEVERDRQYQEARRLF